MAATWSRESGLPMSTPDTSPTNTGWICRIETVIATSLSQAGRPRRPPSGFYLSGNLAAHTYDEARRFHVRSAMAIPTEPIGSLPRPVEQLGTTDDCGFIPFSDDTS